MPKSKQPEAAITPAKSTDVVQKRHQRISKMITKKNVGSCIQRPGLTRLARRGGVKRLSEPVREEMREMMLEFLEKIVGDAGIYSEHGKRRTITLNDVDASLTLNGIKTLGYKINK